MNVKINLMVPGTLYKESYALVKGGIFANYSEMVRQAIRSEVIKYKGTPLVEEDRKLLYLLKRAKDSDQLLSEEEMAGYGLKV